MNIAVVCNRRGAGVIYRSAKPCPEKYGRRSVRAVLEALRAGGHDATYVEADMTMLPALQELRPDLVVNMAYGIQGECRYTHVPAMLEMAGVPYTGATPLGHAVSLDKVVAKQLMRGAGVRTPAFAVMTGPDAPVADLRYPLVVKPRHESTSYGLRLVRDRGELEQAVAEIVDRYRQDALVEEYIDGREICVGLLGNDAPQALPAVELDFTGRPDRLMTYDDKHHKRTDEPAKLCPAPIDAALAGAVAALACATFEACHCRDYARVDIRVDDAGRPFVLEINSMASLGGRGSFVHAALAAGLDFDALVQRIVEVAAERAGALEEALAA